MAIPSIRVPYSGVQGAEAQGGGGSTQPERATPESFGTGVGQAVVGAGQTGFEVAQKYQGLANETAMVNADAAFATKVGALKAKYLSMTGMAAYNAFPQYQEDVKSAYQEARANLPAGAQRGFDVMATRTMANHIADGSTYAVGQLKEAQRDSYTSLANAQFAALLDPAVATNPERSQYHLDSIKYAAQAQMDSEHPGLKTDPETGSVSFNEESPEGKTLKDDYQRRLDSWTSQGYVNRYKTLANLNPLGAYDEYKQARVFLPRGAQVALDAIFDYKIRDAHAQNATSSALLDADRGYWQALTNPHGPVSEANRITDAIFSQESDNRFGNQESSSGAIGGAQIMPATFAQYARPGEDIHNPQDNKAVGQRIVDDYTQRYHGDAARVAVAFFSGPGNVAPAGNPTPWIKDVADPNGKTVSSYVSDIVGRLNTAGNTKNYGVNSNGAPLNDADYYLTHRQEILANGDAYADHLMPGDLLLKHAVRQSLSNYMEAAIQNQHLQYTMDNRNVVRAINGDLTNGKPPATEAELRAIPGMSDLLDKVAYQDPKFSETIPTLIGKMQKRNQLTNSDNAYDTFQRVLEPNDPDHTNRIGSQDHLDRLLGRSDGTGISYKDYKDAKPALELPDKFKKFISDNMKQIADANGNIDGHGQQRAVQYYNSVMELYQKKNESGVSVPEMMNPQSKDYINLAGNYMPSRAEQIQNMAGRNVGQQPQIPVFSSPDDPAFAQLASGARFRTSDGQIRIKK